MRRSVSVLILTLALGLLAAPLPAEAQPEKKVARMGYLYTGPRLVLPSFLQGLGECGGGEPAGGVV